MAKRTTTCTVGLVRDGKPVSVPPNTVYDFTDDEIKALEPNGAVTTKATVDLTEPAAKPAPAAGKPGVPTKPAPAAAKPAPAADEGGEGGEGGEGEI